MYFSFILGVRLNHVLHTCSTPNSFRLQLIHKGRKHIKKKENLWYSHPFVSIRVVELHVVTRLNPADGPRLLTGDWRHQDPGTSSEVRCPVAQDHAGWLVDAGGVGVNGAVHLQDDDTVSETLGLTPDTLDAAHCIKLQHNPQQRPEFWGRRRETHGKKKQEKENHHSWIMFSKKKKKEKEKPHQFKNNKKSCSFMTVL